MQLMCLFRCRQDESMLGPVGHEIFWQFWNQWLWRNAPFDCGDTIMVLFQNEVQKSIKTLTGLFKHHFCQQFNHCWFTRYTKQLVTTATVLFLFANWWNRPNHREKEQTLEIWWQLQQYSSKNSSTCWGNTLICFLAEMKRSISFSYHSV